MPKKTPNSASEPNVEVLTIARVARHRVQADRLPGANHLRRPPERRVVASARSAIATWFVDHACEAMLATEPTALRRSSHLQRFA